MFVYSCTASCLSSHSAAALPCLTQVLYCYRLLQNRRRHLSETFFAKLWLYGVNGSHCNLKVLNRKDEGLIKAKYHRLLPLLFIIFLSWVYVLNLHLWMYAPIAVNLKYFATYGYISNLRHSFPDIFIYYYTKATQGHYRSHKNNLGNHLKICKRCRMKFFYKILKLKYNAVSFYWPSHKQYFLFTDRNVQSLIVDILITALRKHCAIQTILQSQKPLCLKHRV